MTEYATWDDNGRSTPPTPRLLAGMYAVEYRKRYCMMPLSPVQDDLEAFDAMLSLLHEDTRIAPYCLEVLFGMKEFHVNANAFCNPNILSKWNVLERARKLQSKNGRGEQSEFVHTGKKQYGVVRV
jgi:hypothetical protein